jgi:hypothetical protein
MSFQPSFPGLFAPANGASPVPQAATPKQIAFAHQIAERVGAKVPATALQDRIKLSAWIDAHKPKPPTGRFSHYPSSKQVAFAERIARIKRRDIPRECFRDKVMMAKWIDGNKPH